MSPPLTPDAEQARRQLADELTNPIYADVQNWLSDQLRKLLDWLTGNDPSPAGALSSGQLGAVIVLAVGLLLIAVWTLMGPVRNERRLRARASLDAEGRTSDQLRLDAAASAASGDWSAATRQLFRALVRSLGERAVIEEFAGMTAHEAAGRAAPRLPDLAVRLIAAADSFDAIAYGRRPAGAVHYEELAALDAEVAAATPVAPSAALSGPVRLAPPPTGAGR